MPINLPNFLQAALIESPYQELGNAPQNYMSAQQKALELALQKELQPLIAQEKQADIDLAKAKTLYQPYTGLSGPAAQVASMERIGNAFGKDSPQYKEAMNLYDLTKQDIQSRLNARDEYARTAEFRASSPGSKLALERRQVEQGILPGSNGQQTLTPEEQKYRLRQIDLEQLKRTSDPKTREKAAYAANIHKTLSLIEPEKLVQFAGIGKFLDKKIQEGKSLTGNESKEYAEYQKQLNYAKFLAKQARQFYGDSIQPTTNQDYNDLVNPSFWALNPKVALEKFNATKDVLDMELETFVNSLSDVNELIAPQYRYPEKNLNNRQDYMSVLQNMLSDDYQNDYPENGNEDDPLGILD